MLTTDTLEGRAEAHFDTHGLGYSPTEDSPSQPAARTRPEPESPKSPEKPKADPQGDAAPKRDDDKKPDEDKKEDDAKDEAPKDAKDKVGFIRKHPLVTIGLAVGAVILIVAGYIYYDYTSHFESTDDAFIAARQIAIAPKITGYVSDVPVTDNQHVVAGQTIAKIDDRDYQVSLDQAKAQVASAKANIANVEAQIDVQNATIESNKAQVAVQQAALVYAQQQASRYDVLAKSGSGTVQNAQQYDSQLSQQVATLNSAQASERVAERQLESLKAQKNSAEATLSVNDAELDQAVLNVTYTNVQAVEPGKVVQLTAEPGEYAPAGTALTMFVPDETWVTANFKETQLALMRPNQPLDMTIDAYPGRDFHGHVESVQPGSGTAFSLLPAQNATGNYVKVVQRVPVKLVLDNLPDDVALGPGMSVVPTVRVDPTPSIWERLVGKYHAWKKS